MFGSTPLAHLLPTANRTLVADDHASGGCGGGGSAEHDLAYVDFPANPMANESEDMDVPAPAQQANVGYMDISPGTFDNVDDSEDV